MGQRVIPRDLIFFVVKFSLKPRRTTDPPLVAKGFAKIQQIVFFATMR
jgi:hypothetical protein